MSCSIEDTAKDGDIVVVVAVVSRVVKAILGWNVNDMTDFSKILYSNSHLRLFRSHRKTLPSSDPIPTSTFLSLSLFPSSSFFTKNIAGTQYLLLTCPSYDFTHFPVCKHQSRTVLSRVADRRNLPFWENLMEETGGLSSSTMVLRHLPVPTSHTLLQENQKLCTKCITLAHRSWKRQAKYRQG